MNYPKAYCTQFTDRECREEDCCMNEIMEKACKEYPEIVDQILIY